MVKEKKGIAELIDAVDKPVKVAAKRTAAKAAAAAVVESPAVESEPAAEQPSAKLILVPAVDLWPSEMNPRKHFDEESLLELSKSIKEQGMLQPVVVRKKPGVRVFAKPNDPQLYEVVCGARRARAAEMIGSNFMVPVIVRELTDEQAFDLMITENLQRKDINVMEEARAFKALHDRGMSQQQIADRFGKSHVFIYQCIELNKCIAPVQKLIEDGVVNKRVALAISKYHADDQQSWLNGNIGDLANATEKGVKHSLRQSVNRTLGNAHFIVSDTQFAPVHDARIECASCLSCVYNTGNSESENYDKQSHAMCMRRKCFDAKNELFIERVLGLLPEGFPVILDYNKKPGDYSYVNLQGKKIVLNGDWVMQWHRELSEIGVPVALDEPDELEYPDVDEYDGPLEPRFMRALKQYAEEEEEYEKDLATYQESQKSYAMAFWYWLENGAQTNGLLANEYLVFRLGEGGFAIVRFSAKQSTTIDEVVAADKAANASAPTIDPADIKKKIARNEQLVEEKLYDALTSEITGLATYGKLNHLDAQPPLTEAEWLLFYANILGYATRSEMSDQVRVALKMKDSLAPDLNDEQLVKVMHNIGPWIIRRHLMSVYHPAQGGNAFKNLKRWNDVAASHPDIAVVNIRTEIASAFEKRNDKLRAQLAELEEAK